MGASWQVLGDIALRSTIVYLALLVGIRLTGHRLLGQLSARGEPEEAALVATPA